MSGACCGGSRPCSRVESRTKRGGLGACWGWASPPSPSPSHSIPHSITHPLSHMVTAQCNAIINRPLAAVWPWDQGTDVHPLDYYCVGKETMWNPYGSGYQCCDLVLLCSQLFMWRHSNKHHQVVSCFQNGMSDAYVYWVTYFLWNINGISFVLFEAYVM